ncbi:PEP-CTERM sorting domain-containing protein [bacterium]|nr:PEP-CTERM sorting domain-containing protein [bacterium]
MNFRKNLMLLFLVGLLISCAVNAHALLIGDAPASYGPAVHTDPGFGSFWFGSSNDADNGLAISTLEQGSIASIDFTIHYEGLGFPFPGDVVSAAVDVWIDWDIGGTFAPDAEKILSFVDDYGVGDTIVSKTFSVPNLGPAGVGMTWLRARLSPTPGTAPTGTIVGGEVEDYEVEVTAAPSPSGPVIPEPSTLGLIGVGILGLLGIGIRQRKKK